MLCWKQCCFCLLVCHWIVVSGLGFECSAKLDLEWCCSEGSCVQKYTTSRAHRAAVDGALNGAQA